MKKYIVIDIGGTAIKYGVIDENAVILEKNSTPTEAFLGGAHVRDKVFEIVSNYIDGQISGIKEAEDTNETDGTDETEDINVNENIKGNIKGNINNNMSDHIKENHIDGTGETESTEYAGVSISTAGIVNTKEGSIFHAGHTMPDYTGICFKAPIEEQFRIPCEVENDVNCAGIAEYTAGAAKGSDSILCLTIGTGIGGCAIIEGKVLHGFIGSGCEVGYMNMHGSTFEKLGAASVMISKVNAIKKSSSCKNDDMDNWDGVRIFDEALKGDTDCIKVIDEMCDILGEGIANICYVLNPETVVMGGGIMAREDYLYPKIRSAMDAKMESVIARNTSLKFAEFKNSAGMIGAYYNFRRLY